MFFRYFFFFSFANSFICIIFAAYCRHISPAQNLKTMGIYINRGNREFRDIVAHEYVDKSSLIPIINATLNSENRYSCVTRCRRFGKSMAAKMLCAYYDKSCDSRELFHGLKSRRGQYIRDLSQQVLCDMHRHDRLHYEIQEREGYSEDNTEQNY